MCAVFFVCLFVWACSLRFFFFHFISFVSQCFCATKAAHIFGFLSSKLSNMQSTFLFGSCISIVFSVFMVIFRDVRSRFIRFPFHYFLWSSSIILVMVFIQERILFAFGSQMIFVVVVLIFCVFCLLFFLLILVLMVVSILIADFVDNVSCVFNTFAWFLSLLFLLLLMFCRIL